MKKIFGYFSILLMLALLAGCATTGNTPLMSAASNGDINAVKRLLNEGADVNAKNSDNWTALTKAARDGNTEIVKLLIEKGADVHAKAYKGYSALMVAALGGNTEIVKLLIEKGADIDYAITIMLNQYPWQGGGYEVRERQASAATAAKLLERMRPKQQIASQPSQAISKEDLKTIVQAAVEGATKQKEDKRSIIKTDIDKPSFGQSQIIMGDNDLAVIIGIEGYQSLPKSDYSFDDAKLMAEYVKALGFKSRNIELLTDEKATKSSIEKTLEAWLPNRIKKDSRVFIYYSGHGAPEPKTGDAYLVPYDGDPNYLEVTGYSLKRLYDNLGKLQVAEITVVLDSCFSGAGGRSVLAQGARPLVMMTDIKAIPSNMAILSATQGSQISTSSPEKGHGVFTYYFLKALKDGKKDIAEIYSYIKPLVEDDAKQINVQQSPSISPDAEKLKGRFLLRR